jgi:hypothetical protein
MKKNWIISILLVMSVLILISGCCTPPKISSVSANLKIPQHTNTWCWAASTEMITDYYSHRVLQCDSSKYVHSNPSDCSKGCPSYCSCWNVCGATIPEIKNNWSHWKFNYAYVNSSLVWDKLKETISTSPGCARSPIQVIWWWTLGGGHVVTAYGYAEAGGEKYIAYYNPWSPDCTAPDKKCNSVTTPGGEDSVSTYDAFVSDAAHTWGDSFYNFKYTGP